jgi:hypothetical protein
MTQDEIIEMLRASCDKDRVDPEQNGFWVIVTEELEAFAKLVAAKAFPDGVDAEWIARRTKYAVEQERANNALLCYQQRKHWDALACSDAIRAGTRARGEA